MELGLNEELIEVLSNEYKVNFNKANLIDYDKEYLDCERKFLLIECEKKYFMFAIMGKNNVTIYFIQEFLNENNKKITKYDNVNLMKRDRNKYLITRREGDEYIMSSHSMKNESVEKIIKKTKNKMVFKSELLSIFFKLVK